MDSPSCLQPVYLFPNYNSMNDIVWMYIKSVTAYQTIDTPCKCIEVTSNASITYYTYSIYPSSGYRGFHISTHKFRSPVYVTATFPLLQKEQRRVARARHPYQLMHALRNSIVLLNPICRTISDISLGTVGSRSPTTLPPPNNVFCIYTHAILVWLLSHVHIHAINCHKYILSRLSLYINLLIDVHALTNPYM